jgi:hypothetical protein
VKDRDGELVWGGYISKELGVVNALSFRGDIHTRHEEVVRFV